VREGEGGKVREGEGEGVCERQRDFECVKKWGEGEGHDDFYIAPTAASLGNPLEFLSLLCYYIPISRIRLYIIQYMHAH